MEITRSGRIVSILAGLALLGLAGSVAAQTVPTPKPRPAVTAPAKTAPTGKTAPTATTAKTAPTGKHIVGGRVFLLRGLANVFSLGMDRLGAKLRAKGFPGRVTNHSHWRGFAAVLITEYKSDKSVAPIVIIGHSLGADAAVRMANYLASNGVPVRLVVAFDGVAGGGPLVNGVEEVVNYYKPDGYGRLVNASPGYKGKLNNVDLSDRKDIDHLNIDKSPSLHEEVIAKVTEIFTEKPKKKPAAKPKPPDATVGTASKPPVVGTAPAAGAPPSPAAVAPAPAATATPAVPPPPAPAKPPDTTAPATAPALDPARFVDG